MSTVYIPEKYFDLEPHSFRVLVHLEIQSQKDCIFNTATTISNATGIKACTVKEKLCELAEKGFVHQFSVKRAAASKMLQNKHPQRIERVHTQCAWCGSSAYCLESHHYPIPACEGGTETVDICGSCHSDFHWLTEQLFYTVPVSGGEL